MKTPFTIHSVESAPRDSQPTLEAARSAYGFVPNLLGMLAEAPAAVEGYAALNAIFERSSFDAVERQVLLLSVSYENACAYCMAAHSTIARSQGVPEPVVRALRNGEPIPDERLDALSTFAYRVVSERGWVDESALESFLNAGFTRGQVLEVVLAVGLKTISNYANHLAATPLDDSFEGQAWAQGSSR